ncbi:LysE family translocator [Sporomusa acidovorans]|nr:LysE family translocator [Sporomusa acidovorans]
MANIHLHNVMYFTVTSLALVLMPGPNTLYVLSRGITQGRKAAVISAFGASTGDLLYALFAALGLVVVLQQSAMLYDVIKTCGAAYLLLIGIQTIKSKGSLTENVELTKETTITKMFMKGFLTSALNPKTALFFMSFLPQFIDVNSEAAGVTMLAYGFIFFVLGLIVLISYALLSSVVRQWLVSKQRLEQYFRWVTGTIFVALGIRMMMPEQR